MITLLENILTIDTNCELVTCQFDQTVLQQQALPEIESTWGVELPEKLHKAVVKRKAEFIAGRYCAQRALNKLNHAASLNSLSKIGIGEKRQPLWPQGFVGSITHSHGFAAAAVAQTDKIRGVGIDSEQTIKPKTVQNVASHILVEEERFEDNQFAVDSNDQYLTLIFSAKESIFKCLYPLVEKYFDFKDARITLDQNIRNTFSFELRKTLNTEFQIGYQGRGVYQVAPDFVHTAVVLNATQG